MRMNDDPYARTHALYPHKISSQRWLLLSVIHIYIFMNKYEWRNVKIKLSDFNSVSSTLCTISICPINTVHVGEYSRAWAMAFLYCAMWTVEVQAVDSDWVNCSLFKIPIVKSYQMGLFGRRRRRHGYHVSIERYHCQALLREGWVLQC